MVSHWDNLWNLQYNSLRDTCILWQNSNQQNALNEYSITLGPCQPTQSRWNSWICSNRQPIDFVEWYVGALALLVIGVKSLFCIHNRPICLGKDNSLGSPVGFFIVVCKIYFYASDQSLDPWIFVTWVCWLKQIDQSCSSLFAVLNSPK